MDCITQHGQTVGVKTTNYFNEGKNEVYPKGPLNIPGWVIVMIVRMVMMTHKCEGQIYELRRRAALLNYDLHVFVAGNFAVAPKVFNPKKFSFFV